MGRNADNERIKLKATFYNNLGVAAAVAGILTPALAVILTGGPGIFSESIWQAKFLPLVGVMLAAFLGSALCRLYADNLLAELKD